MVPPAKSSSGVKRLVCYSDTPNKMVPTFTDKPEQEQKTVVIPSEYPKEQVKEQQRSVELPTADMRQLVREARRTLRDAN